MKKRNLQPQGIVLSFLISWLGIALVSLVIFTGCKSKSKTSTAIDPLLTPELVASFTPADQLIAVTRTEKIQGSTFTLNYRSDRMPGSVASRVVPLTLTQNILPANLKTVKLEIDAGGQHFTKDFAAVPNLTYNYIWEGKDAKGNPIAAPESANLRVGLLYAGQDTAKWSERKIILRDWDAKAFGLGGWSLSPHHAYDGHVVYMGDGQMLNDIGTPIHLPGETKDKIIVPSRDGAQVFVFDSTGRHLHTLNAITGKVVYTFKYDGSGFLSNIDDAFGNTTTIERNSKGIATAFVAPYGQRTELKHNKDGWLSTMTGPMDEVTAFNYTKSGLLTDVTEPQEKTVHFEYDGLGRLTKTAGPDGTGSTLARKAEGNQSTFKLSSPGQNTVYSVGFLSDEESQQVYSDSGGTRMDIKINHPRKIKTVTYPNGASIITGQQSDPRWKMRSPSTRSVTFVSPSGTKAELTMDRKITLQKSDDPLSLKISTETVSMNGNTLTRVFDKVKKEISTTTPAGRQQIQSLDDHGRVIKVEAPGMYPWSYVYDNRGRITNIAQGSGTESRSIAVGYGTDGQIASITDPLKAVRAFEYDRAGRLIKQVLADGSPISYAYDPNGNLISLTPAGRSAHKFKYGALNNVLEYTPPSEKPTSYNYDAQKRVTNFGQAAGAMAIEYDNAGLTRKISFPGGEVNNNYDPKTRSLSGIATGDGNSVAYTYDGFLLTGSNWTGPVKGSVTRSYDNNFRVNAIGVNGHPVNIQYDKDGWVVQAGDLSVSRDPQNGLLTGSKLGNLSSARINNGFGEIRRLTTVFDIREIFDVQYERDLFGRISKKTEVVDGQSNTYAYTYDPAGRLTEVSKNGAKTAQYKYDGNGNMLDFAGATGNISGKFDGQDRITKFGDMSFSYSTNGELAKKSVSGKSTSYTYDALGNLRALTAPDGSKIEYVIDGANRRIGKKLNGNLVQGFLYQEQLQPAAELDGQNNVVSRFVYATRENVPDYMMKGGQTFRIVTDHLGSPRLVVDIASGNIIQRIDYDEFGNIISDSNPGFQPFGFAGGLYDQHSRLTRFGLRDYDASIGRWTTKDPLLFGGGDANLYAYVHNDPINYSDHMGTTEDDDEAWVAWVAGGIIGTLAAVGAMFEAAGIPMETIHFGGTSAWSWSVVPFVPASAVYGGGGVGLGGAGTAIGGVAAAGAAGVAAGFAFNAVYDYFAGQSLGDDWADMNFGGPETFADWYYHFWNGYGCGLGFKYDPKTGECYCDNWSTYWNTQCPPGQPCAGLPCKSIVGIDR